MRLFKCQACGQIVHFENTLCEKCGHRLAYLPAATTMSAIEPEGDTPEGDTPGGDGWKALAAPGKLFRLCDNEQHGSCNWLIEAEAPGTLCLCCRHNRTIPDISQDENAQAWRKIEWAKHRLFYSLLRLKLPLATRLEQPETGLAFDFLADVAEHGMKVMTGHDNGLITIALQEADDAEREKNRVAMHEPYRTLLGHFRHEIGHYFWDRLVRDGDKLEACRALFGDDATTTGRPCSAITSRAPPPDWPSHFVTAYATMHPWEDFAETWAHYLHLVDTLETAGAFGLSTRPSWRRATSSTPRSISIPTARSLFDRLVESWMPLTIALNSLNRSMGQPDLYPFVLSTPALEKLAFVHALVHPDAPA